MSHYTQKIPKTTAALKHELSVQRSQERRLPWNIFSRSHPDTESTKSEQPQRDNLEQHLVNLLDYLPQASEEQRIADMFQDIGGFLEEHVDHFYSIEYFYSQDQAKLGSFSTSEIQETLLTLLREAFISNNTLPAADQPAMAGVEGRIIVSSARTDRARQEYFSKAVQGVIGQTLITSIQPFSSEPRGGTLLPQDITYFLSGVPAPIDVQDDPVYIKALGQWRSLSWYLRTHPPMDHDNEDIFQKRIVKEIKDSIEAIEGQLRPFADPDHESRRRSSLGQLLSKTADLGRLLSSQVAEYDFVWDAGETSSGSNSAESRRRKPRQRSPGRRHRKRYLDTEAPPIAYFPGLVKLSDHHGNKLPNVKRLCEPRVLFVATQDMSRQGTDVISEKDNDTNT
ncbi:MAG: hypothetical protein Q9227_008946 [Pyrenula ochraceoflavens]